MQFVFYIAYLLGTELIIKDDHTDLTVVLFLFVDILLDFLEFTLSHIGDSTRSTHTLRKALHGDSTGCVGEKFQFVEIFLGLCLILLGVISPTKTAVSAFTSEITNSFIL